MSDHAEADDLAAEVFVKAIAANLAGAPRARHIKGYLFRIAHNLVIDFYRARDRRRLTDFDALEPVASREPSPHMVVETAQVLQRALCNLTDPQAEVIHLRDEGFSFGEIADQLGKTEGAIKALLHRARGSMRARRYK